MNCLTLLKLTVTLTCVTTVFKTVTVKLLKIVFTNCKTELSENDNSDPFENSINKIKMIKNSNYNSQVVTAINSSATNRQPSVNCYINSQTANSNIIGISQAVNMTHVKHRGCMLNNIDDRYRRYGGCNVNDRNNMNRKIKFNRSIHSDENRDINIKIRNNINVKINVIDKIKMNMDDNSNMKCSTNINMAGSRWNNVNIYGTKYNALQGSKALLIVLLLMLGKFNILIIINIR